MYPFLKITREMIAARFAPPLPPGEIHETRILVWPWDLDVPRELNNGRAMTLMDAGRIPALYRSGVFRRVYGAGMYMTMAGATVRWRKRITVFNRLTIRTRIIGWDTRFFYVEQAMVKDGEVAVHAIYRVATTKGRGLVDTSDIVAMMGWQDGPTLPEWVAAWSDLENARPWPPGIGLD